MSALVVIPDNVFTVLCVVLTVLVCVAAYLGFEMGSQNEAHQQAIREMEATDSTATMDKEGDSYTVRIPREEVLAYLGYAEDRHQPLILEFNREEVETDDCEGT